MLAQPAERLARDTLTVVPEVDQREPARHRLLRDMVGWLIAVALLAVLCVFLPWELGKKADPFVPAPAGIRPEWYFLSMFQALKYFPATIAGIE